MTDAPTTLNSLLDTLNGLPGTLPLIFATPEGDIGGGYHLTELKQASIASIDCGGNIDEWRETHVQLLDGQTGDHMDAGKFQGIAGKSMQKLPNLGDALLFFEFAHNNNGLRRYSIASISAETTLIRIQLTEGNAVCKPAAKPVAVPSSSGCCGADAPVSSGCCS